MVPGDLLSGLACYTKQEKNLDLAANKQEKEI